MSPANRRRAARAPTREEAKRITRRRLLDAAARVLAERGYGGLSTGAVAGAAGVAQPTFYVHFADKDDLLRALAEETIGGLRSKLRAARERVRDGADMDSIRATFRIPFETLAAEGELFRLYAREFHQPGSPLGEQARRLSDELRKDLAEDLVRLGLPAATAAERERLDMIAAAMIAQTEALVLAHLDGRHRSAEAAVDVLAAFAAGALAAAAGASGRKR